MVQINFAQKEIQCKIVYYGPGMSGKTTNLELVHGKVPEQARGELTSIATTGERTLYFDYMPLDLGQIAGIRTKFQLYTVPGQIYYKSTRRLVLQGVDGIVFVADSSASKIQENKESLADLEENLQEMGKTLKDVPIVMQYNKRDLPDAMSMEELEKTVNVHGFPCFEAVATRGDGVFPTLKSLASLVLERVNQGSLARSRAAAAPRKAAAAGATAGATETPAATATATVEAAEAPPSPPKLKVPKLPKVQARPPTSPEARGPVAPPPPEPHTPSPNKASTTTRGASARTPPARPTSFADRVVSVPGLEQRRRKGSLPVVLVLGALIAGAVFFALTRLF